MNKTKSLTKRVLSIALALTLALGVCTFFAGCGGYKVTVRLASTSIAVGETTTALVAVAGTDDDGYTLSSADESVATVGEDGVITGVGSGTTEIIATAHADGKSTGKATLVVGGGGEQGNPVSDVKISIALWPDCVDRLSEVGDTSKVSVTVENADDKTYTLAVTSGSEYISVDAQGNVKVIAVPQKRDVFTTVTATSNADPRKTASKTFRVEAPRTTGSIGDLTSEMLNAISNDSITASGRIVDRHDDLRTDLNDYDQIYSIKVEMEENKWRGSWTAVDEDGNPLGNTMTDMYVRNDEQITIRKDEYVQYDSGHTFGKVYIDKNNEVKHETVRDYKGVPVLWENQCMYNLLSQMRVEYFDYVEGEDNIYVFDPKPTQMTEYEKNLYLVQLAVSLTPLLTGDDVFSALYVVLNDEKTAIKQIIANTAMVYNTGNAEDATETDQTFVYIDLSKVGSTVVEEPEPFGDPDNVDVLKAALTGMKNATSYYYEAVDTTTRAPASDPDDYSGEYSAKAAVMGGGNEAATFAYIGGNMTTNRGTVGGSGWVTEDAVLIEKVSQYQNTMDDRDMKYEYYGYRQFDGYVERFEFVTSKGAFRGIQKIDGATINSVIPQFEFSANIFEFVEKVGSNYVFRLRSDAIMSDVATQISLYGAATNAEATTSRSFTITVNENGFVSSVYPYNISDNYYGYVTTTYKGIGNTVLPNLKTSNSSPEVPLFEGYEPRLIPTNWKQMQVKYYHPEHSTIPVPVAIDAESAFKASYGEEAARAIPTPDTWLFGVFGDIFDSSSADDGYSGPFFGWSDKTDGSGNVTYYDQYAFTCQIENDTNYPTDAELVILKEALEAVLNGAGFVYDPAISGKTNPYEGVGDRFITFKNEAAGLLIVVENNYTNNFWIYIYKLGAFNPEIKA